MAQKQSGFSLIELSVVIVIIGFIVAAIVQGQNILENAKIRSLIGQFQEHQTSANSFKLKYLKYPGDFDEAFEYWGQTCATPDGVNCQGDGDGKIEFIITAPTPDVYEGYRAWQHLSYARMTKANYIGTETTGAAVLETDIPKSSQVGGYIFEYGILGMTTSNVLAIGIPRASTTTIILGGALTPQQAYAIDNKSDGGKPSTGKIRSIDGDSATSESCVNDPSDDGANKEDLYNILNTGRNCVLGISFDEIP